MKKIAIKKESSINDFKNKEIKNATTIIGGGGGGGPIDRDKVKKRRR